MTTTCQKGGHHHRIILPSHHVEKLTIGVVPHILLTHIEICVALCALNYMNLDMIQQTPTLDKYNIRQRG